MACMHGRCQLRLTRFDGRTSREVPLAHVPCRQEGAVVMPARDRFNAGKEAGTAQSEPSLPPAVAPRQRPLDPPIPAGKLEPDCPHPSLSH